MDLWIELKILLLLEWIPDLVSQVLIPRRMLDMEGKVETMH
jgi:hypothetical protein